MATYKVWLTVKDKYGNTKEVDGGTINVDLATLTPDEVSNIEEALPLEDYVTKVDLDSELTAYATDEEISNEVAQKVTEAVDNKETIKYSDFELSDE